MVRARKRMPNRYVDRASLDVYDRGSLRLVCTLASGFSILAAQNFQHTKAAALETLGGEEMSGQSSHSKMPYHDGRIEPYPTKLTMSNAR